MTWNRLLVPAIVVLFCAGLAAQEDSANATEAVPVSRYFTAPPLPARSLTGIGGLTLTDLSPMRSRLVASVSYAQTVTTNPLINSHDSPEIGSHLGGDLQYMLNQRAEFLRIGYAGSADFNQLDSNTNSVVHSFSILNRLRVNRYTLEVIDQLSCVPKSQVTLGGEVAGFGSLGQAAASSVNVNYLPGLGLSTLNQLRIMNVSAAQATYAATPRLNLTAAASFGMERFPDGDLLNSNSLNLNAGFNRLLSAVDTLGAQVTFARFTYNSMPYKLHSYGWNLLYSRQLSRTLKVSGAGGGSWVQSEDAGTSRDLLLWNAQATVDFRRQWWEFGATYSHNLSGGEGLILGAISDDVILRGTRQLGRDWKLLLSASSSHDKAVVQQQSYSVVTATTGFSRSFGRRLSLFANYSYHNQFGNRQFDNASAGVKDAQQHIFSAGLSLQLGHPEAP